MSAVAQGVVGGLSLVLLAVLALVAWPLVRAVRDSISGRRATVREFRRQLAVLDSRHVDELGKQLRRKGGQS